MSLTTKGTVTQINYSSNSMDDAISKIKSLSILEVSQKLGHYSAGNFVQKGSNHAGKCFVNHSSTSNSSFYLNTRDNYYHCWNCSIAGDPIQYVRDYKGLTFMESLHWFVDNFPSLKIDKDKLVIKGYKPPTKEENEAQIKEKIITELYEEVMVWGKELLHADVKTKEASVAFTYLISNRGYSAETLKETDIFFISNNLEAKQHLYSTYPERKDAIDSLALGKDDFTIAMPYRNTDKTITGLIKRHPSEKGLMTIDQNGNEKFARWDSTYELKKKSLYGLYRFTEKKESVPITLVEGYPDAEYLYAKGLNIAALGSALPSKDQLNNLAKAKNISAIYLSLDNDGAGKKNILDVVEKLLDYVSVPIYVLKGDELENSKDLDEYFRVLNATHSESAVEKMNQKIYGKSVIALVWAFENMKEVNHGTFPAGEMTKLVKLTAKADSVSKGVLMEHIKRAREASLPIALFRSELKEAEVNQLAESYRLTTPKNPIFNWDYIPFYGSEGMYIYNKNKTLPLIEDIDPNKDTVAKSFSKLKKEKTERHMTNSTRNLMGMELPVYPRFDIEYDPINLYEIDIVEQKINTYVPPKWRFYEKNSDIIIPEQHFPVINSFVKHLITEGVINEWFMYNWISAAWHEHRKVATSWLITGIEGSGKNVLANTLITGLWGVPNVITVGNTELTSQYNDYLFDHQFVIYNEINEFDARFNQSTANKLKTQITDKKQTLVKKYHDTEDKTDYSFKWLISNSLSPIPISSTDRRYNAVRTPNMKLMNAPFIKEFGLRNFNDLLVKMNEEFEKFVQFIINYDYDLSLANAIQNTTTRRLMIDATATTGDLVVQTLLTEDLEQFGFIQQDGSEYNKLHPIRWPDADREDGIIKTDTVLELYKAASPSAAKKITSQRMYNILRKAIPNLEKVKKQRDNKREDYFVIFPDRFTPSMGRPQKGE